MEEELHECPLYCRVAGLDRAEHMPDETIILRFGKHRSPRHLLEEHQLAPSGIGRH